MDKSVTQIFNSYKILVHEFSLPSILEMNSYQDSTYRPPTDRRDANRIFFFL